VLRLYADLSRAQVLLRYSPQVSMGEGLRRLLAWYDAQGVPPERLLDEEIVHNWTVPAPIR
jgi:hypothetical protein